MRRCGAIGAVCLCLAGAGRALGEDVPRLAPVWWWGGGLTGAALLADRSFHNELNKSDKNTLNKWLGDGRYGRPGTFMEMLGEPYSTLALSGVFYGAGRWTGDLRARRVGRVGARATVLAGVSVVGVKWLVGRNRPYTGNDVDEYRPFRGTRTSRTSFPSGHSAVAFAMAGAVADEYRDWRVSALSYGTAAAVGLARVYQDRHWLSDVVGGATLGIAAGRLARRWDARRIPVAFRPNGLGLRAEWAF